MHYERIQLASDMCPNKFEYISARLEAEWLQATPVASWHIGTPNMGRFLGIFSFLGGHILHKHTTYWLLHSFNNDCVIEHTYLWMHDEDAETELREYLSEEYEFDLSMEFEIGMTWQYTMEGVFDSFREFYQEQERTAPFLF